jgi:nucleotide sugar dehydrogenase
MNVVPIRPLSTASITLAMPGTTGSAQIMFQNMIKEFTKNKIGIIGLGFVGNAIRSALDQHFIDLVLVDPGKGLPGTYEDIKACDGIFVCVPSPEKDDGSCDTSILENVLTNLKAINYDGVIISKCTAPPDVYMKLGDQYPNLVHAPEFLTAANAERDYYQGRFCFIGGRVTAYTREAERIIKMSQPSLEKITHCSIGEASLAKYTINSFLATKVIFMNEIYKVAKASGLEYKNVASMVISDPRIGSSHMQVPGPDGNLGFGGACFPKDTKALLNYAASINETMHVLEAAVKENTFLRLTEPK